MMSSGSSTVALSPAGNEALRLNPLQPRATRRVAQYLEVAEAIIAELGYEALTTTAVAERAGTSIGALYRWFPDKTALAHALRTKHVAAVSAQWENLSRHAGEMSVREFADALVDAMVVFTREHPAYLALLDAPIRFVRDPASRQALREQFIGAFRAHAPALEPERALLVAHVAVQIVRGLATHLSRFSGEDPEPVIAEFKRALYLYLADALGATE